MVKVIASNRKIVLLTFLVFVIGFGLSTVAKSVFGVEMQMT